ncbi:MAG: hypothetical protein RR346_12165, partial [Bacteroidales bacterium]
MLPQIIFLFLHTIALPLSTYFWIQKKTAKYSLLSTLVSASITLIFLYWGGFFDAMPQQWIPQVLILV